MGILSYEQCRRFYDRLGVKQDRQTFYEKRAIDDLIEHGRFGKARSVFEFGCGSGQFALNLFARHLLLTSRYTAVDMSGTMVQLARTRPSPYRDRVTLQQLVGPPSIEEPDASHDRFVSNFVLDLLSTDDIERVLSEAHRVLSSTGLLCLTSLTDGINLGSRMVSAAWKTVHHVWPELLGGCRPIRLLEYVSEPRWRVLHHGVVTPYRIPSEIVVAEKREPGI